MTSSRFRIGAVFPQAEIEADAAVIRDFAQAVEDMGYSHLVAYDHVVGAGFATRPNYDGPYSSKSSFHEPLVLFSYLAGVTRRIDFMSAVFILSQRQTTLFGKQAANLDIFCGGRLQLGVGIGWNPIEYETLDIPFEKRGARLDDQIAFLRRLWTEPTFTAATPFNKITDAGINPLPIQRPIPIWIGGNTEPALARAARLGDGWIPYIQANEAKETMAKFHAAVKAAGREGKVGFESIIMVGARPGQGQPRNAQAGAADVEIWRAAGSNGVCVDTMYMGHRTSKEHLAVLGDVAKILKLR